MKRIGLLLMMGVMVAVSGCASRKSGDTYTRDETRRPQTVRMGVVEGAHPVKIEGTGSSVGMSAGTVVGGIAGSTTGQGKGSAVGAVLGAVVGGVAGAAVEEGITREDGMEITVRLDSGRLISVVQAGKEQFHPGDRVRVLENGGVTRITH